MKRLILAGAGHAHIKVLHAWSKVALPDVELVVVSPLALTPYAGMVTGWMAGAYRFDDAVIDVPTLCMAAGANWVQAEVARIEPDSQRLVLDNGASIRYDLLSLNVGSVLTAPKAVSTGRLLMLRPLSLLRQPLAAALDDWINGESSEPFQVTAVGAGPAGVESLLTLLHHLRQLRPERAVSATLISRTELILPSLSQAARQAALDCLRTEGVTLQLGHELATEDLKADLLLWATGAEAQEWQRDPARRGELAVTDEGFIRVDDTLRSISHPSIFAVGDCAVSGSPQPRAAAVAVRMGPVLANNLQASLGQGRLRVWRPSRHVLSLMSTGDGRAIASWGRLGARGRWAWRWKDFTDRRFVRRFRIDLAQMQGRPEPGM